MADAAEIIRRVIDDSGHWELVADYQDGDLSDRGIMRHLNAGQRFLDRHVQRPETAHRQVLRVLSGQYAIPATGMQRVVAVEVEFPGGVLRPLRRMELSEARALYGTPFQSTTPGIPEHWVRNPERLDLASYQTPIGAGWHYVKTLDAVNENGNFSGRIVLDRFTPAVSGRFWKYTSELVWSPYYDYSGPEWGGLSGGINAVADYVRQSLLIYLFPPGASTHEISILASGSEGLSPHAVPLDLSTLAHPSGGYYVQPMVEAFNGESALPLPLDESVSGEVSTEALAFLPVVGSVEDLSNDGPISLALTMEDNTEYPEVAEAAPDTEQSGEIAVLPPPDTETTLRLFGDQYARDFEALTDITWWSANEPDLLIRAARGSIEGHLHRNTQGSRDFLAPIIEELKQIYYQRCAEQVSGPTDEWRLLP